MSEEITAALDVQERLDTMEVRLAAALRRAARAERIYQHERGVTLRQSQRIESLALDLAECEAALRDQKIANNRIGAELAEARERNSEKDEAMKAAQQCITDFLDVYKRQCSMLVLDEAVKSLRDDALRLVNRCLGAHNER